MGKALAHNTEYGNAEGTVPLIILDDEFFPFEPGERDDWHEASESELATYESYWGRD